MPLAKRPNERAIQRAILRDLARLYPDVFAFHIANGGFVIEPRIMGILLGDGLRPGMPDLGLVWTGDWGMMEVKSHKGRLSPEQVAVHAILRAKGVKVAVVRSTDDVIATLAQWGVASRLRVA